MGNVTVTNGSLVGRDLLGRPGQAVGARRRAHDMAVLERPNWRQNPALTAELRALCWRRRNPHRLRSPLPPIQTQEAQASADRCRCRGGHFIGRGFILIVQQCVPSAQEAEAVTITVASSEGT